ncbi:hypothetical protein [Lentzea flava]|uniref:SUKH-4 immunity protein n=1 Tax=Lentzea flava TaxID=103732 RepID=A0ABQ2VBX7_9PSEU|nr:hypothetical protein [Lentzea flava]MCP2200174.1 hypothetical protein [Lentzea flava]GGU79145.1 hypothetical protein GCM10010178_82640 [Lentzea flava]
MADLYELLITAELPAGLPEPELAELRWHLGLGPQPDEFTIVTDFPIDYVGDGDPAHDMADSSWETQAEPLLAGRGPSDVRVGGVDFSELALREGRHPAWVLTSRQEIHGPTQWHMLIEMIQWLERRVAHPVAGAGLSFYLRHCEDTTLRPARLVDGKIVSRDDPSRLL